MKTRYRDLTEKYRSFRLQPDTLFRSRIIQTFFNKFTKKGKKALSKRYIVRALSQLRYTFRYPETVRVITRVLRSLRLQFVLVNRRQGKKIIEIPVPIRRNKRDVLSIQMLYNAINRRHEEKFVARFSQELLALTFSRSESSTLRGINVHRAKVYEERVSMEKRWK